MSPNLVVAKNRLLCPQDPLEIKNSVTVLADHFEKSTG